MNTENSKANESNKFCYYFTDKLNLKNPNTNIALINLSIYYTWKNVNSACNNNKFKISAPTWNNELDLPDGSYSVSDIQDYFEYVIKKHQTVAVNGNDRYKHQCYNQIYVIRVMHILQSQKKSLLQEQMIMHMIRNYLSRNYSHLLPTFQKLIIHLLIMQKT